MRRLLISALITGLALSPISAAASPQAATRDDRAAITTPATDPDSTARLGVMVMSLTGELRQHYGAPRDQGVLVARVEPGSAASAAGVQVGDVLTEIDHRSVNMPDDVVAALAAHKVGDRVEIAVVRDGSRRVLATTLSADKARHSAVLKLLRTWPFGWMGDEAPDQRHCGA
jgi:S1-C subfamily serine protease